MELGIAEDFSANIELDAELKTVPESGIYLNSGVHPLITVNNLLQFLPVVNFQFTERDDEKQYNAFSESRNKSDIVTDDQGVMYQCIKANVGQTLDQSEYWLQTNIESVRLKSFIYSVKDKAILDLNITKRLVDNQYLYYKNDQFDSEISFSSDYIGWAIEPKNSDYVSFKLNEIGVQTLTDDPVNVILVNQGQTISITEVPSYNGRLQFERVDLKFSGKGTFYVLIESQNVKASQVMVDPYVHSGFSCYTVHGSGILPDTDFSVSNLYQGIGISITAYLDSSKYVQSNLDYFGKYLCATFEYMAFLMFLQNANSRSNREQRIQMNETELKFQAYELNADSSVVRYRRELSEAKKQISLTFDSHLSNDQDGIELDHHSV